MANYVAAPEFLLKHDTIHATAKKCDVTQRSRILLNQWQMAFYLFRGHQRLDYSNPQIEDNKIPLKQQQNWTFAIYLYFYLSIYIYIYIYIHIYFYIYIYLYLHTHTHAHAHAYMYIYVCMYVCLYVCMCMYVYVCMYVCMQNLRLTFAAGQVDQHSMVLHKFPHSSAIEAEANLPF